MTDETLESNSGSGNAGSPNPSASPAGNGSSTSTFDPQKMPEQLESYVSKAIEKALQSTKDKRISGIEKTLDDFKPVMEQVKALLTPEQLREFNQIQRDAEFEDLKRRVYGNTSTSTPAIGNQESAAVDVAKVFGERGLDLKDPQVALVANMKYASPQEAELAAYKLRDRLAATPTHNPAQDVSIVGKSTPPQNVDALTKQYQTDMIAARGKPDAIRQIKEQAMKNGVPVDSVTFV